MLNALWLFTRRRKYTLFLKKEKEVSSPNVRLVKVQTTDQEEEKSSKSIPRQLA